MRRTMGAPGGGASPAGGTAAANLGRRSSVPGSGLRRVSTCTRPLELDSGDVAAEILPPPSPVRPTSGTGEGARTSGEGGRSSAEWWRTVRARAVKQPAGDSNV